jgi:putative ABC transport system ATP-binding protein
MTMALELRDVTKRYPRGAIGAQNVDLVVEPGSFTALFGPSGAGKTTMLQLMGLLVSPDGGEVVLDGEPIHDLPEAEAAALRRRRLGFVFQSFGLLSLLSAEENVGIALRLLGVGGRSAADKMTVALEGVGLADRAKHRPDELSGGEQQRVALARALVHQPDYLLADEPTGELDSETGASILGLLKRVASGGTGVIIATHDPAVLEVADRRLFVSDGQLHSPDQSELDTWVIEGTGGLAGS